MNDKKVSIQSLDAIASNSMYAVGIGSFTTQYSFEVFSRYIKQGPILEIGPAEGVMTEYLFRLGNPLTLVEGSSLFSKQLKEKYPDIEVVNSLFENFKTEKKYRSIILGHVLEHVDDPVLILQHVKQFLKEDGVILSAVPNANSIHRQAAVLMGLLPQVNAFSELDKHHGHKRVYSIAALENDFSLAGLKILKTGGYWLKPVSNSQMEKDWTPEMIAAFMKLGEKYPKIAGEIYIVAGI